MSVSFFFGETSPQLSAILSVRPSRTKPVQRMSHRAS